MTEASWDALTLGRYTEKIDRIDRYAWMNNVLKASVVVVTFGTPIDVVKTTVKKVKSPSTEIIIIDNNASSENPFMEENVTYVAMKENAGVCVGRNLGAVLASSDVVIFLDDDAIPDEDFVVAHLKEHCDHSVLAVRGRCLPKTHNLANRLAFHYDLGFKRIPSPVDLEGNSSFKRKDFLACGGFNELLPLSGGWEGVDVSFRLVEISGNPSSVIYSPDPVIYHDYKSNTLHLLSKLLRHRRNLGNMSQGSSDLAAFFGSYGRERNPLNKLIKALRIYQRS